MEAADPNRTTEHRRRLRSRGQAGRRLEQHRRTAQEHSGLDRRQRRRPWSGLPGLGRQRRTGWESSPFEDPLDHQAFVQRESCPSASRPFESPAVRREFDHLQQGERV